MLIEPNLPPQVRYQWSSEWPRATSYPLACVWLKRLGRERQLLRRYSEDKTCNDGGYCQAVYWVGDFSSRLKPELEGDSTGHLDHADDRWPTHCDTCHQLLADAYWQLNRVRLYSYNGPYGKLQVTINNCPPGSLYHARWLAGCAWATGPDGLALMAVCPNGSTWNVDGQASNCTLDQYVPVPGKPGWRKFVRTHYCWVRHGDPRKPSTLHVDKVGVTCAAGAGSIVAGNYHGFLHNGGFTAG